MRGRDTAFFSSTAARRARRRARRATRRREDWCWLSIAIDFDRQRERRAVEFLIDRRGGGWRWRRRHAFFFFFPSSSSLRAPPPYTPTQLEPARALLPLSLSLLIPSCLLVAKPRLFEKRRGELLPLSHTRLFSRARPRTKTNNDKMSISLQEYLRATAITVHGTFFQRLGMRHLGSVDQVGDEGAVRGLTVVVTGPTAGIGRATAAALARKGAHGGLVDGVRTRADSAFPSRNPQLTHNHKKPPKNQNQKQSSSRAAAPSAAPSSRPNCAPSTRPRVSTHPRSRCACWTWRPCRASGAFAKGLSRAEAVAKTPPRPRLSRARCTCSSATRASSTWACASGARRARASLRSTWRATIWGISCWLYC